MKIKQFILDIVLIIINLFVHCCKIKKNKITIVSLESKDLESDLLLIYNQIKDKYDVHTVTMLFNQSNLWTNFLYFLNTIKQIYHINTSKIVIINNNNYVISKYKRDGVQVIQIWHASGAIKKFGNSLDRKYKIQNYDVVLAPGKNWIEPYQEAFNPKKIELLGMPRLDCLYELNFKNKAIHYLKQEFPQLINKKVFLYAPTFRGNIYEGIQALDLDLKKLLDELDEDIMILCKLHPLLKNHNFINHPKLIQVNDYNLYDLFMISDGLISDYSSIVFDYSLLEKPIIFYVPDLESYQEKIGCYIDISTISPYVCKNIKELIICLKDNLQYHPIDKDYFEYRDNQNTNRVIKLIDKMIKDETI